MDPTTNTPLAYSLKKMRKLAGLTQENAAAAANIDIRTLYNYESGRSRPPLETLNKLTVALGLTGPQASDLRRIYKADDDTTPATEVATANAAPDAPGRFTSGNCEYYELEKFSFGAMGEQPAVTLDRDWPKKYYAEKHLLKIKTPRGTTILPSVELLSATSQRPLRLCSRKEKTFYQIPSEVSNRVGADNRFPQIKFDSDVVRLLAVSRKPSAATLHIQPAHYTKFAKTNLLYDFRRAQLVKTLRDELDCNGQLHPLDGSPLANILGINTLVIDADGNLLIAARSANVAYRAGQLTPSSSGTLDWNRDDPNHESSSELNISGSDLHEDPIFLGMCRELHRGGIPDLFYFARVNLSVHDVNDKRWMALEKIEVSRLHYFAFGELAIAANTRAARRAFDERFHILIAQLEGKASLPLLINLALWRNYVIG